MGWGGYCKTGGLLRVWSRHLQKYKRGGNSASRPVRLHGRQGSDPWEGKVLPEGRARRALCTEGRPGLPPRPGPATHLAPGLWPWPPAGSRIQSHRTPVFLGERARASEQLRETPSLSCQGLGAQGCLQRSCTSSWDEGPAPSKATSDPQEAPCLLCLVCLAWHSQFRW